MPLLEDLLVELEAARDSIVPQIEGLNDYLSLNLKDETKQVVGSVKIAFMTRKEALDSAIEALESLKDNGYPAVDNQSVNQTVYDDLKENAETIEAALAKFEVIGEAVTATITPGIPREQT